MDRFQFRRDTSARWTSINPILLEGEIGFETDTKLRKMGDGVNRWNNLDYLAAENVVNELGNSETLTVSQTVTTDIANNIGEIKLNLQGYISNKGVFVPSGATYHKASDLVRVETGDIVRYALSFNAGAPLAVYDTNKKFIESKSLLPTTDEILKGDFVVTEDVGYIRVCNSIEKYNDPIAIINPYESLVVSMNQLRPWAKRIDGNIWSKPSFIQGVYGYINATTGLPNSTNTENFRYTDFIEVKAGSIFEYSLSFNAAAIVAMYNENREYLPANSIIVNTDDVYTNIITIPEGVRYIRCCNAFNHLYNPVMRLNKEPLVSAISGIEKKLVYDLEFNTTGWVDKTTGATIINSNPKFRVTDLIRVNANDIFEYSLSFNGAAVLAFYNEEKNYLPNLSVIATTDNIYSGVITIPEGVGYIKCCNYFNVVDAVATLQVGSLLKYIRSIEYKEVTGPIYNLANSIKRPIVFTDKKVAAFGDSITHGLTSTPEGVTKVTKGYLPQFVELAGATLVTNKAVNGAAFTTVPNWEPATINQQLNSYNGEADIVWVAAGINDFVLGCTLGKYGDNTEYTFYGAVHIACENIKVKFPNATVIFVTPIPVTKSYNGQSTSPVDAFRSAIYEVATTYGFNVVSGSDLGMPKVPKGWSNSIIADWDGAHPTVAGHTFYAKQLTDKLL